jgi:hypothetical protein
VPAPTVPAATARAVPPAPGTLGKALAHPAATVRWLWLAYMTPGRPGRPVSQTELRWMYTGWLVAFLLKMLGSTWDVSWHFRWLRDDLAPPHLLNSVGTAVVIWLVIAHSYSGYAVDKRALRLMQCGIGMFLFAIPADIVNHRIYGLDITSWSPTHALLYLGTAIMLAGAIRGWWLYAEPGRPRNTILLGLWLFFFENVLFPNQHQEYGVLSLRAWLGGHTYAEPSLLDYARSQGDDPAQFMLPVPSWVHPTWLICAGLLTLVVARKVTGPRWTATTVAAVYLGYRCVAWGALVGTGFPPSVVPFVLIVGAVGIDLAVTHRLPGWLAGPLVAGAVYAAAAGQEALDLLPPWNWWSAIPVVIGFGVLWTGVDVLARSGWLARWRQPVEPFRDAVREPAAVGTVGV